MSVDNAQQDALVWEFFKKRRSGFFIEVGANDPTRGSQTWALEQQGWTGLLVEPQGKYFHALEAARPKSKVVRAACCSPGCIGTANLYIPADDLDGFATTEKNIDDHDMQYQRVEEVPTCTLDSLLDDLGNPTVDFVSVDTEGTELDVLRGLDLKRHHPALVIIEDKGQSLDKHRHLNLCGYRLVKRTELNNWYVPRDVPFTMTTPLERLRLFRKVFLGLPFRKLRRWRHARRAAHLLPNAGS